VLDAGLRASGVDVVNDAFFDTVLVRAPGRADELVAAALAGGVNLRRVDADHVSATTDETTTLAHLDTVLTALGAPADAERLADELDDGPALPADLVRTSPFCEHPVFSSHRSETAMMRYLRRLSDRDIALDRAMIPLGSCTMKLNAAAEMEAITWPRFAQIHPFAPLDQSEGYRALIDDLERWLVAVTGYAAVSL
jgi:glycine dehydrogenase